MLKVEKAVAAQSQRGATLTGFTFLDLWVTLISQAGPTAVSVALAERLVPLRLFLLKISQTVLT